MNNTALKWLYAVPGRNKYIILALIAAQGLYGGSGVLYAFLLRGVVDSAAAGLHMGFVRYLVLAVLLTVVQLTLRAVIRWLTELAKSNIENIFKARLTDTLLHKDYLRVSSVHSGEWLNRLTNDTMVVANGYVDIIPGIVGMAVKFFGALIMIVALEPYFAAVLIPGGAATLVFTWYFRRFLKCLHRNVQEADGRLRIFLQERIVGMMIIRSFLAEGQTLSDTREKLADHKSARMKKAYFSNVCNLGFGAAMSGMYLFGVGWCGYGILNGNISFGTLTAIIQLITQIQVPFANITGFLPQYYAMIASAERLMEAEQFESDASEAKSAGEIRDFYTGELQAIGLKNASFTYYPASEGVESFAKEKMPVVLHNISLEIRKGDFAAFTGHSGCGKSTTLKMLMCVFRLDSGQRYFKDRNGICGELSGDYRRLFAYVPQGNYLMRGTVRELVSFSAPENAYDDDRLEQALEIACAREFVAQLEHGADTLLGERGTGLSEGQMQRLAIARAVFSQSPILLLDEATSALDAVTERRLLNNLRSMTDKTVMIVTHRPAALDICNRVMEFTENGVICRSD